MRLNPNDTPAGRTELLSLEYFSLTKYNVRHLHGGNNLFEYFLLRHSSSDSDADENVFQTLPEYKILFRHWGLGWDVPQPVQPESHSTQCFSDAS